MSIFDHISFVLNDRPVVLGEVSPMTTLLDWLRGPGRLRGTKEGCAEGDCGACSVVVERVRPEGGIERRAVNACLTLMGQVDGLGVRTVEGLRRPDGGLHPVQDRMAAGNGTQCGFCTPGFVMSAYALLSQPEAPDQARIHDALAGNLCRCTGYRPIVEAVRAAWKPPEPRTDDEALRQIAALPVQERRFEQDGAVFHRPTTLDELLVLRERRPAAMLLAGGTDLGLLASRERRPPREIIHLARVDKLTTVREANGHLEIGAAVTYSGALPALLGQIPALRTYMTRLGSEQIRNAGTIGGNLGTASPIGDMLPVLLALDATVRLHSRARGERLVPMGEFVTGYRQTVLAADEVIGSVIFPIPGPGRELLAEKVSKRRDQDISTLTLALALTWRDGVMRDVRVALGGMAARPSRAPAAEAVLEGKALGPDVFERAAEAVVQAFSPIDDLRGSGSYRLATAANLMRRMALRLADAEAVLELDQL